MRILHISLLSLAILIHAGCSKTSSDSETTYTAEWESLAKVNEEPEWFQDAKLGIYFHWGPYTVPAFGTEWYPRWMHFEGREEYKYHLEHYGHPSEVGYHDLIPMFTAENFDAAEWVDLFHKAGAKFAGPVAEHHDGFSMWDSDVTPWNAKDKGPRKDILGEITRELRKRDMKVIATFHHARNLQRFDNEVYEHIGVLNDTETATSWSSHYPFIEGLPPASNDPDLRYLYGNIPEEQWLEEVWLGKVKEVTDKYSPDIIWFDGWLDSIPEDYRTRMAAYFYNHGVANGQENIIVRKQMDLPLDMSVDDHEKTRMNEIGAKFWMTDETLSTGSWSYTRDLKIKSARDVLHVLIDITSKNGVLLLNISPMSNGTIPDNQREVLLEMGDWLSRNGEAIYGTRPWYTFGEGPTKEPGTDSSNRAAFLKIKYSKEDFRFTTKDNVIYVIQMGESSAGETFLLNSFSSDIQSVKTVTVLGSDESINWSIDSHGLNLTAPAVRMDSKAIVYKVELD